MTYHDDDDSDNDAAAAAADDGGSCGGEVHLQVNHDDTDLFKSNLLKKQQ